MRNSIAFKCVCEDECKNFARKILRQPKYFRIFLIRSISLGISYIYLLSLYYLYREKEEYKNIGKKQPLTCAFSAHTTFAFSRFVLRTCAQNDFFATVPVFRKNNVNTRNKSARFGLEMEKCSQVFRAPS